VVAQRGVGVWDQRAPLLRPYHTIKAVLVATIGD
jgi:hypothetical protein